MSYNYKILYFNPEYAEIGIQFDGKDCYNFLAPHKDGIYLTGQALEDAIQLMYPYTPEERLSLASVLTGGQDILAKVEPARTE